MELTKSRPPSSGSYSFEVPSDPASATTVLNAIEGDDAMNSESPLMMQRSPPVKQSWVSDGADLFILLCSFLFTATSIVLLALVFNGAAITYFPLPYTTLSILQRVIATFSVSITTAVIMVTGKRYVLFKLAREGLRSRRVAVYSNPAIGNLASHLVLRGVELPLVAFATVWGLALATSLTVNDIWQMGSISDWMTIPTLSGPLDATPDSSYLLAASEQLGIVMSSLCLGVAGTFGLINVSSTNFPTSQPMGVVYYPPPPQWAINIGYSYPTAMNGFNISMEQLSSVPSTAQNLNCRRTYFPDVELWYNGSDNETLSVVVVDSSAGDSIFQFNATAIILDGILSSTGNYTEFAPDGTSRPNVMETNQWAQDITSLICNTTCPEIGDCVLGSSLSDLASLLNANPVPDGDETYTIWSSVLGMALGAYSAAVVTTGFGTGIPYVPVTMYDRIFTTRYGIYILTANTVVSVIMLIIALKLRMASHLGPDFINSTRLLLDPLKNPELFNASLDKTVDSLADPYMVVKEDSVVLLADQEALREGRGQLDAFALRRLNPFRKPDEDACSTASSDATLVFHGPNWTNRLLIFAFVSVLGLALTLTLVFVHIT